MMKVKQLVPKLRFREFVGEWEFDELGNVSKVTSGGTPNRNNQTFWNGDIPWITTSLINFNIIDASEEYITQKAVSNSSAKLFPEGTVLMAMYGQGQTRGKVAVLGIEATTNQACGAIIPKDKLDTNYLYQNLAGRYNEIRDLSNDGGQQNLSGGILKSIKISFPSLPEQQKIASFLSAVDEKIQQLTKKKELLEHYKKGVMQQLFSGKLRFKDADGKDYPEWEEKRLGEIMRIPNKLKPVNFDVNKLLSVKLHTKGLFQNTNTESLKLGATNYFVRKKGQFIYGKQNLFNGAFGIIPEKFDGFYSSGDIPALDFIPNKVIPEFVLFYISQKNYYEKLENIASGSGSKRIHEKTFLEIKITFPSLPEQQKIATYLSSIDTKIERVNQQITQTQTFKKGLLQQLFV